MKYHILPLCSILAFVPFISHAEEAAPAKPAAPPSEKVAAAKPDALIEELYKTKKDVFMGQPGNKLSPKFLASALIKLLALDAKRAKGELGAIDFDVLSYSQDERDIKKFATQSEVKGDTAVVKTTFENHGERVVIKYSCVKEADQWRIADVTYEDGTSLVKLLSETE
jgi:Protein of unknown function (DUF3828)